jgi:hypothetical protein
MEAKETLSTSQIYNNVQSSSTSPSTTALTITTTTETKGDGRKSGGRGKATKQSKGKTKSKEKEVDPDPRSFGISRSVQCRLALFKERLWRAVDKGDEAIGEQVHSHLTFRPSKCWENIY